MSRYIHASDCAIHNAPALKPGPCDCAPPELQWKPFPMAEAYRRIMQDVGDEDDDRLEAFNRLYLTQWSEGE